MKCAKYKRQRAQINPFFLNAPFLYLLETLENLTVFGCFQGVEKGCIENKWVKPKLLLHFTEYFAYHYSKF